MVHYWISRTPQPQSTVGKNQFSPSLVLGISTDWLDLFKNTIYISFGQAGEGRGGDGTGDQFKIDICQGQAEIYGTTVRGIINQNVKEAVPESNSIPTEQVHKRENSINPPRFGNKKTACAPQCSVIVVFSLLDSALSLYDVIRSQRLLSPRPGLACLCVI